MPGSHLTGFGCCERRRPGLLAPPQALVYLCACIPNHAFKLATTFYRPPWVGFFVGPATAGHWLVLLASQAYYFTQCSCSSWGCYYTGALIMLSGGHRQAAGVAQRQRGGGPDVQGCNWLVVQAAGA